MIARSTPWGTIWLGDEFYHLPFDEQQAVLAHERGHIAYRHAWKRIAWLVTLRAVFRQEAFWEMCKQQELEADRYAVMCGHRLGMKHVLLRLKGSDHPAYPSIRERLENINV